MARLDAAGRAKLPDRAFAYIDSQGRRRLPIYDAAHVRNALSRFNQVAFEDEEARDLARRRLLAAAKRFRIVPIGFIDGQLRLARGSERPALPSGFVTMLMSDIEGSTTLVDRLGNNWGGVLADVRALQHGRAVEAGGLVVETRADEFFAVFERPAAALEAAVAIQRDLDERTWAEDLPVRVRVGVHSGYPTLTEDNYIGLAVHQAARICSAAHGGQIVVSGDVKLALTGVVLTGVSLKSLGTFSLRGIPGSVPLHQVVAGGLARQFPALRTREVEVSDG